MRLRTTVLVALLAIGVVLAGGALYVARDPKPWIERYAARALDRTVMVAEFRIGWRNPLAVEISGLHIANADWGSEPDFIRIDRLSARIAPWPLLRGVLRFERLDVAGTRVLLERRADGAANWKFPGGGPGQHGGIAVVPKNRTQFPTLIDFALRDGAVIYRMPDHDDIALDFHDMAIQAAGDDRPVTLALRGGYNGAPVRLTAGTASFDVMRDAAVPFDTKFTIVSPRGTVAFDGTMDEPLDFDGVKGALTLEAGQLGEFMKFFGAEIGADFPLQLAGILDKTGERWRLAEARGMLAESGFGGTLALQEAGRGEPDHLMVALNFAQLDLKRLMGGRATKDDDGDFSLRPAAAPAMTAEGRIGAQAVWFGSARLDSFAIHGRVMPGEVTVSDLRFGVVGGRVEASGNTRAASGGSRTALRAALVGADAARLLDMLGEEELLGGKIDAHAVYRMTGDRFRAALRSGEGQAVLMMTDGRIAQSLLEKISLDLRAMFRRNEAWVPVSCLLGVVDVREGRATLTPMRLRTADTALLAVGTADLSSERIEMMLRAEGGPPGAVALKLPIRIHGNLRQPSVTPWLGTGPTVLDTPVIADNPQRLVAGLRPLVNGSACRS